MINMLSIRSRGVGAGILLVAMVAGCAKTGPTYSPWDVLHGTANLAASKAVDPTSLAMLASYPDRTGSITVHDDSTVTGWIKLTPADTSYFSGTVTFPASGAPSMSLGGLTPPSYLVITSEGDGSTFGIVSNAIIDSDVTGDGVPEMHRIYWEFHR